MLLTKTVNTQKKARVSELLLREWVEEIFLDGPDQTVKQSVRYTNREFRAEVWVRERFGNHQDIEQLKPCKWLTVKWKENGL